MNNTDEPTNNELDSLDILGIDEQNEQVVVEPSSQEVSKTSEAATLSEELGLSEYALNLVTLSDAGASLSEDPKREYYKMTTEAKIEAIIFASPKPIKQTEILELLKDELTSEQIEDALKNLRNWYDMRPGGIRLIFMKSLGYQFQTAAEAGPLMERMFASRPRPISKAGLETLAVIAYRQPVTRAEIEYIRGVDAGGILKNLMDKGLVECVGRKPDAGRPMLFGTSQEFLKVFRMGSVKDLPPLESFQPPPELVIEANKVAELESPVNVEQFISGDNNQTEEATLEQAEPQSNPQSIMETESDYEHGTDAPAEVALPDGHSLEEGSRTLD